jgi:hypothetical protein
VAHQFQWAAGRLARRLYPAVVTLDNPGNTSETSEPAWLGRGDPFQYGGGTGKVATRGLRRGTVPEETIHV